MMIEQLEHYLIPLGYQKVLTGKTNIRVYCHMEAEKCQAVLCGEFPDQMEWTAQQHAQVKESLRRTLMARGI